MAKEIAFTKYDKYGAYHWLQYEKGGKYKAHADRIKKWVKEKKVLDVGAGDGLITSLLGATGIDNEKTAVILATEKGVNIVQGNAYNLPFSDNSFEAITMVDVLEHFGEPEKALKEAHRVAPVIYITTPERGMVKDKFHVQEWLKGELPTFMKANGFSLDGEVLVVPEEKNMYARFVRTGELKEEDTCSILIPARNEEFLKETLEDLLKKIRGKTDIFVCLDGEVYPNKTLPQDPKITYIQRSESWGQRKATNQLCKLSRAKYVIKTDAHCIFDKGFDVKLMADMQDDWTVVPIMKNLHAFDWVCPEGHRRYQSKSGSCEKCGLDTEKEVVWYAKKAPNSIGYRFDTDLHFQYFNEIKQRPEAKNDLLETMSLQGSFFMLTRDKYWELDICDEEFGSWGAQGTEVACKTWLSGGKCMVNRKTWYAHLFRTAGGDFSFPYKQDNTQVSKARKKSQQLFLENSWDKQIRPLSWLVDKFEPVPDWHDEKGKEMLMKIRRQPLQ